MSVTLSDQTLALKFRFRNFPPPDGNVGFRRSAFPEDSKFRQGWYAESPLIARFLESHYVFSRLAARLQTLDEHHPQFVALAVEQTLLEAVDVRASDVHIVPGLEQVRIDFRVDGVLQHAADLPARLATNVVARLKVLADLLTYRVDVPQEGRIKQGPAGVEMRLSAFPTIFGEKAVVRLFAGSGRHLLPDDLGLPADISTGLERALHETAGVLLLAGPAGSGKTTTAYACLRELQRRFADSKALATLEDPVESILPGVVQSAIQPAHGFDYATGLKSLLRQDPDVLLVGEIRDPETAETVFRAGLTGHLVLTTFHAGSAAEAVSRLRDLGVESYLLRAALLAIVCQRLVRRLCDCGTWSETAAVELGLSVPRSRVAGGCAACGASGYRGRMLLVELLQDQLPALAPHILSGADAVELQQYAVAEGMQSFTNRARMALEQGETSAIEIRRVLGFRV